MSDILDIINEIYGNVECSYLLFTYVNRNHWVDKLKHYFPKHHIDNLTDFNYNKCFSMCINLSYVDADIGSEKFDRYVKENLNLYRLIIEISAVAQYCIVKYSKYYFDNGEIKNNCRNEPYIGEHHILKEMIKEFISEYNLSLLDDKILMTEVTGISLELKEAPVSVYNCLFEDTYSYYPYSKE